MNKEQALNSFWNGFGIPAFDENSVPEYITKDGALVPLEPPYITYETRTDDFGYPVALTASIWYRSSTWADITAKAQEISDFIGRGGRMIAYSGGAFWIQKASPWASRMDDPADNMIRRIVLNVTVEYLQ